MRVGDSVKDDYRPWDPCMTRLVDVVDAIRVLGSTGVAGGRQARIARETL